MPVLDEISTSIKETGTKIDHSVVAIGGGRGSGVVLEKGKVLTNAHNLRGDSTRVTFADGRTEQGRVSGADVDGDLLVLDVETGNAPALSWAKDMVALGDVVYGSARGSDQSLRVTAGFVSATARSFRGPRGRRVSGSIEHTAPLGRGSSGGPIVNGAGELLGINTNRLGEGFYLAIPADADTRSRVDALGRGEVPTRIKLGVALAPAHVAKRLRSSVGLPDREGVLVRGVEDESAADAAGVQKGDLITAAAGKDIASIDDLFEALASVKPGGSVELKIVRGAEDLTLSAPTKKTAETAE
jgi:serine protease Do